MKIKEDKYLKNKFKQYQSGEISDLERGIVDDWFEERTKAEPLALQNDQLQAEELRLAAYSKVLQRIQQQRKKQAPYRWLKIAGMLLLISSIGAFTFQQVKESKQAAKAPGQIFITGNGQNKKITLQDGTEIWMNAATRLRVDAGFTTSAWRRVYLEHGEAFFQVKRDTLRPFKIITQDFMTTVLGTSFNIRSYPELHTYKVAVVSGKVKVDYLDKPLAKGLTPNEVLTYNLISKEKTISKQEVRLLSNWRTNRSFYLENLTLLQIGAALSRQYNMEVKVINPQQNKKTYTLYLTNQPVQQAVQRIALQTGMSYQLTKNTLTLNANPL